MTQVTPTRQRNAVSEGVALGLVALGYDRVPFETWRVDLAFEGAWSDWPYRNRFSQVSTDLRQGLSGYIAMTRADERKHTISFYWGRDPDLIVYWRQHDFNPESADDLEWAAKMIDGDVPLEGWKSLTEGFWNRFSRDKGPTQGGR